jgi:large subunit ribosomal protein L22
MANNYSFQNFNKEVMARASSQNVSISLKKTVETAREVRGKKVSSVINFLEKVTEQEAVVPYRKYRAEMAHRRGKGIDTGGFPVKVAQEILRLVKSAQKNATEQEIAGDLYLLAISATKGTNRYHAGRYSGRKMKSTNLEVVVGLKDTRNKKISGQSEKSDSKKKEAKKE